MPQTRSSSQVPSPSTEGSAPVSEVLDRIQVRDPSHKPSGVYGRRMTDYESRSPLAQTTVFFAAAALIAGSLWTGYLKNITKTWNFQRTPVSSAIPRTAYETLSIPEMIHPRPEPVRPIPDDWSQNANATPENLKAHFLGPRMLELQWDSLGEGYVYRLYAASDMEMKNAQAVTEQPLRSTHMAWSPEDNVNIVWLAVTAIDPQGQETSFSRPLLVQLPS